MNPRQLNKDYETMNFSGQSATSTLSQPQDGGNSAHSTLKHPQDGGNQLSSRVSCESVDQDRSSVYSFENSDGMALMSDSR